MKSYYVQFRLRACSEVLGIGLLASNKVDAYDKAVYEEIPKQFEHHPYVAWVHSVTYSSGKCKVFAAPSECANV